MPTRTKPVSTRNTNLNPGSSFLFSFATIIKKSKTGIIKIITAKSGRSPEKLYKNGRADKRSSSFFKSTRVLSSPIKIGNVSLPTILSPCISRRSKKAVRTKTIPMAQIKTGIVAALSFPWADSTGNNDVTIPHAKTIRIVFDYAHG